jgi:2-succinyl-5-enolpyruvyl-6-hydroxy-3-cyclohexene-1-carboxylate synthase
MSQTTAESLAATLVDELARCGVTDACLSPGSRSAPLALALHADRRIRLHVRVDERSASFLALGLAKASGRAAVVLSTSGTAAANFYPAVVESDYARVPLIILTADRPPELRSVGANQTIDQTKMFGGAVRWWAELGSESEPSRARHPRSVVSQAWHRASGSPSGPVHLNVSLREPLVSERSSPAEPLPGRDGNRPWHTTTTGPASVDEATIDRLASKLAVTEKGVIVAGDTDVDPDPITALSRVLEWPVLAEPLSGLRSSEMSISTYDALLRSRAWAGRHRPEFALRLGRIGTSKALLSWLDDSVAQVLVDGDGALFDPQRSVPEVIRADPALLADQLAKAVETRGATPWTTSWGRGERLAREVIDAILDESVLPSEPRVARDLADLMPSGSTLVVGSSMPIRDLDSFMRVRTELRVVGNRGASGIDGFVSTALGVALASSGQSRALTGDLSLLHDANGLTTLGGPTPNLDLVTINNDGGGIFSFLPLSKLSESFETLFGTPHGLDLSRLAEAYGCEHALLESANDLESMLSRSPTGIRIIEVRTNRQENVALHQRIWDAVGRALDGLT